MNVNVLANDNQLLFPLKKFFDKKEVSWHQSSSIQPFLKKCISHPSICFIIQSDIDSEIQLLDLLKDLRFFFGAFPAIIVIGRKNNLIDTTLFLDAGVDNIFQFPYDNSVIEDFLHRALNSENFFPIKYRYVPSGGSPARLTRPIAIKEISSNGIIFSSRDFYSSGTIFHINLGALLYLEIPTTKCKVISSQKNSEDSFDYTTEYFNISTDEYRKIRFKLKSHSTNKTS